MKKTFKRAGVAVLSMAMLLSMGAVGAMSASAYTGDNGGLTVTSTATTIKAYKVAEFTDGAWSWVSGITGVTAADMTTVLEAENNADSLKTIANKLAADSGKGQGTDITAGTEAELAPGYYLLISSGAGKVYQNKLVEVKKGAASAITDDKSNPVTINKTITNVARGGEVIADTSNKKASVADNATITYKIETDVPAYSNQATVASMHDYVITDTYDANLKNISISSVSIGNDTLTRAASGNNTYVYGTGTNSFTVTVDKATVLAHPNTKVVVTFTAQFDAPETPATDYKYPNNAELKYDNTFNATGGEDTLTSEADVYSVPLKIYKTDGTNAITSADGKFKISGSGISDQEVTLDASGYAKFDSLPAGEYTITETKAPDGYKAISGTAATITISVANDGTVTVDGAEKDNADKYYSKTIVNTPQESLPGTGGMGTVLFTVGGAAIVLAAGAMFVVYMRKRKNEE